MADVRVGRHPARVVRRRGGVPRREHARAATYEELSAALVDAGGFVTGAWCGSPDCEAKVKADTKATIRFLPFETEDPGAPCVVCGQPGIERATWAIAY